MVDDEMARAGRRLDPEGLAGVLRTSLCAHAVGRPLVRKSGQRSWPPTRRGVVARKSDSFFADA